MLKDMKDLLGSFLLLTKWVFFFNGFFACFLEILKDLSKVM